jgi:hypothetical protein
VLAPNYLLMFLIRIFETRGVTKAGYRLMDRSAGVLWIVLGALLLGGSGSV